MRDARLSTHSVNRARFTKLKGIVATILNSRWDFGGNPRWGCGWHKSRGAAHHAGRYNRRVPELPEVETIRTDLEPLVAGQVIARVEIEPATLHLLVGDIPMEEVRARLEGHCIQSLGRRGKYLLFKIVDDGWFVVHLRMTGRIIWRPSDAPDEPYQRASISFEGGHDLRWSDLRKFGTWRFLDDLAPLLAKLGPEPIDETFTWPRFREAVSGRSGPIKAVLLDQRRMSGLGNIYVDEALFRAGVRPDTHANDVSVAAMKRLHVACREVLEMGIANRGASFKDYVDGEGRQGTQQMHVLVFRRDGKPCYTCGTVIERNVVGGRGTHFCPRCQPKPRRRHG